MANLYTHFYSIPRFLKELAQGRIPSGEILQVGGWLHKIEDSQTYVLKSQTVALTFTGPAAFLEGKMAVVEFRLDDFDSEMRHIRQIQRVTPLPSVPNSPVVTFAPEWAAKWAQFLSIVRTYFTQQGVMEVTTPTLVINPGMEPELEPFATTWKRGTSEKELFLCTSPELHLKQMLASGYTDIFEIKTVFRNEEFTERHEPEFQMLEWYRAFANLNVIKNDFEGLLHALGVEEKIESCSVAELFLQKLNFVLRPDTTQQELVVLLLRNGESPDEKATWNDLFHHLWVAKIEPFLPQTPIFITDYPPSLAALAEISEDGWAGRFEFFWKGMEIGNAFQELTDAKTQRERFENDQKTRVKYGRTPLEIDENFMKALDQGLPPSAGIAVGLDRLFMCVNKIEKIQNARAFSGERVL